MITVMRRYRRALQVGLLIVVAAFVASLFVFGTKGFGDGERADAVATVNGEAIPLERYQQAYQSYMNMYSQASRSPLTPEMAERLGLSRQVTEALIEEALVVQKARAEGLEATDEEVNVQVHAIRAFHEDGRFTRRRFEDVLKRAGLRESSFVDSVRRELTVRKVQDVIRNGVKVSDGEVADAFTQRREEVRAAWALVDIGPLVAAATASDEELAAYLRDHGGDFRQPERRKIQYVSVSPKDFVRPVSEAAVEKYYTEHAADFDSPPEVKAAHILVRVPETGGSEGEDAARAKIADVIKRAKAGEDFAKLATAVSEDPGSKTRGGDLGWVKKGDMVPQFEEPLFKLRKGELSEPVRTPFGFHAIKVFDVRQGGRKPLKEVAGPIRDRLAAEAADRAAKAKADELRPPLQVAKDFMAEGKKLGLTPVETTIAKIERPAGLPGGADPLEEVAFALAAGGVSTPVQTPAGYVVVKALDRIPAGVPPLTEVRDRVTAAVKRQKAETVALERATQLAADAKSGDFAAAARKAGAATGETPRFSRAKPAERLPGDAQLAALQAPPGGLTAPVKTPQGYYVLKTLERVAPNASDLAPERDKLQREVLVQKQNEAWESWVSGARAGASIQRSGRTLPSPRG
jgi:peptidyl-prolyl cis-trans isomerase D